jgi:hypothetical protein
MALDLSVRKVTWGGSDMSWIKSEEGTRSNISGTLDLALFNFAATFTSKKIPSGVVLGKVTATGKYGPYSDAAGDGRTTAVGHLFTDVDVTNLIYAQGTTTLVGSVLIPILIRGVVLEAKLPTNHGLDAAGKANLPFVQYV